MPLHFKCRCGALLDAPDYAAGRGGECPACSKIVVVPQEAVAVAVADLKRTSQVLSPARPQRAEGVPIEAESAAPEVVEEVVEQVEEVEEAVPVPAAPPAPAVPTAARRERRPERAPAGRAEPRPAAETRPSRRAGRRALAALTEEPPTRTRPRRRRASEVGEEEELPLKRRSLLKTLLVLVLVLVVLGGGGLFGVYFAAPDVLPEEVRTRLEQIIEKVKSLTGSTAEPASVDDGESEEEAAE
jgi:hypothetical protein